MPKEFVPRPLDVRALAQAGESLSGSTPLSQLLRLVAEVPPALAGSAADRPVAWSARGELRTQTGGVGQVWLHLEASAQLPLVCQRCMTPVDVPLEARRDFRFVADEGTASAEDEDAEEDILVFSRDFDLLELVEDELIMDVPIVPRHDVCPSEVKLVFADENDEVAAKPANPFAALEKLKTGKTS
jgi:uncharacterized protein